LDEEKKNLDLNITNEVKRKKINEK